jgi:RND family efflux transporter MFP subunit
VKVLEMRLQRDQRQFVLPGEIKARWESPLSFRVGGKLLRRAVEVGQRVAAGDLLAILDDSDLRLAAHAQQATLEATKADAVLARSEAERMRRLFERKLASESERDRAVQGRDAAEAKVRAVEAQLASARHQEGYTRLVADEPGIVTALAAEEGQVLSAGQTLVRVARLTGSGAGLGVEREVALSIPEARLAALSTARLTVSLNALPGRTWEGRLRELAPAADAATRTFAARIGIKDVDAAVALGMSAQVQVELPGEQVLLLPLTALSSKTDQPQVWRWDPADKRVHAAPVTLGAPRGDAVIVQSGIAIGDRIVVAGAHLLREGLEVRPLGEAGR